MRKKISQLILAGEYRDAWKLVEQSRREGTKERAFIDLAGAVCLLGFGHVRQAEEWLESCEHTGPEFYYLDALIHLHARRPEEALLCYTRIIDEDPSDTFADRLIDRLRADEEKVQEDVSSAPIERYLPLDQWFLEGDAPAVAGETKPPLFVRAAPLFESRVWRIAALTGAAAVLVALGVFVYIRYFKTPDLSEKLPDPPSQGTIIPMSELRGTKVRFTFESRAEVIQQYEDARKKILEGRVNEARVLLNEIELSNAGFELKERALLLKQMIPWRAMGEFGDPVELDAVLADPDLYNGVQLELDGDAVQAEGYWAFESKGTRLRLSGFQGSAGRARISGFFEGFAGKVPVVRVRAAK